MKKYIHIVLCPDNNYAMQCAVAICSAVSNSKENFCFHIFSENLSAENKIKLGNVLNNTGSKIVFHDMRKYDFSAYPLNRGHITVAAYYRLKIPSVLPEEVKRAIYLDCDIVVCGDLAELYNTDLKGKIAGVVEDESSVPNMRRLHLPKKNNYFNSGVILFDLEKLRNFDFENKLLKYFAENKEIITMQDQDMLNGVLNGYCKYMPLGWNADTQVFNINNSENQKSVKDMEKAAKYPEIIHYTYIPKPWTAGCRHPKADLWWHYLKKTDYRTYYLKYSVRKISSEIKKFHFLQKVFSVKNKGIHKVVTLFGLKMKFKSKRLIERENFRQLNRKLDYLNWKIDQMKGK